MFTRQSGRRKEDFLPVFVPQFNRNRMATPAAARPLVKVYNGQTAAESGSVALPAVFTAPIRRDIVHFVHLNMAKNKCVVKPAMSFFCVTRTLPLFCCLSRVLFT